MRKFAPSDFFLHRLAMPRLIAAGSLLAIGAVHLQQYIVRYYRVIPTIGPLFLLNFIAATVLGLYLLVPARARVSRVRLLADTTVALSGIGVAAGGLSPSSSASTHSCSASWSAGIDLRSSSRSHPKLWRSSRSGCSSP